MSRKEDFKKASQSLEIQVISNPWTLFEKGCEYGYQYAIEKACDWLKMMDVNDYLKIVPGFGYVIEDEDAIKGFRRVMEE